MKTNKFLGKNGLTQTEASHLCNIAKEMLEAEENYLNSISPIKTTVSIEGDASRTFTKPSTIVKFSATDVKVSVLKKGDIYKVSAWLQEGIKAKQVLMKQVEHISSLFDLPQTIIDDNKELFDNQPKALYEHLDPEDDSNKYLLEVDDLCAYFTHEAAAAHIGKAIHPTSTGFIKNWRYQLKNITPLDIKEAGKTVLVTQTEPLIATEDIEILFFDLQKEHREHESKLNYFRSKIKDLVVENNKKHFQQSMEINSWNDKVNNIIINFRNLELQKVSALKIVIPEQLKETIDFIQTFAKK